MFWTRHVQEGRELLRRAFETANQIGDLTFAAYYYTHLNTYFLAAGDPLDKVQVEVEHGLAFARNMRFGLAVDSISGQLGLIRTLRGLTPIFGSFNDAQFDELLLEFVSAGTRIWRWPRARIGSASCRHATLPATMQVPSRPHRGRNSCSRHRRLFFECAEYHFYSALCQSSILRVRGGRPMAGACQRHWPRTTDSSRSGRRLVRKTSRTAQRSLVRRLPGLMAARSMP